jgi:7-carboxy-7-deazaguanine synthase
LADARISIGEALPLMEAFYTVQGEGLHAGRAAYFIRLGGCDVGCVWCDVKESWPIDFHPMVLVKEIVEEAKKHPARLAVITGGEPLMHNLEFLTSELQNSGFETNIETSGAYPLSGKWNWICLSPKKFKKPLPEIYNAANELKIIVFNKTDFKWAEEQAAQVSNKCSLLLQPEWSKAETMMPLIIDYVKVHPEWRISLQTHKFMDIP